VLNVVKCFLITYYTFGIFNLLFIEFCALSYIFCNLLFLFSCHLRNAMQAWILAMARCLCPPITSQCSVKTAGRIELVFGMEASFDLFYDRCYNDIQISTKIRVLPSGTMPQT